MKKNLKTFGSAFTLTLVCIAVGSAWAHGRKRDEVWVTSLKGTNETPQALSTSARGTFVAVIDEDAQEIRWRLSYEGFVAPGTVTQAHVHFGQPFHSGGIMVFFCTNLGNGPAGTQTCPLEEGTVTGTIRPADVIGPAAQGISAGEFADVVAAIRAGAAYANVHSTAFPAGEIRGELERR
jgi:hypothetical protein